jgi:hypothetical protein
MGREKDLKAVERGQLDVLARRNVSTKKFSIELGKSRKAIALYLANPGDYAKKRIFEHKNKEGKRTIKRIYDLESNKSTTCRKIKTELACKVSRRTINRYLRNSKNFKYLKKQQKTPLTSDHNISRLKFSKLHTRWGKGGILKCFRMKKSLILIVRTVFLITGTIFAMRN